MAGMKPGAVAVSRSGGGTVAFSWEHEPGVSKQSPAEAKKPTAGARRAEAVSRRTPATAKKAPAAPAEARPAHPHRLHVPPPPGGPGAPADLPSGKSSRRRSRRVRPRDDPFLAAYLACTDNGSNSKGTQRLLGWGGLGLGLGLGLRGFGLSCKTSCGAVEECVVRLAKIPEVDED